MRLHGTYIYIYIYICIGHNFVLEHKLLRTLGATLQQERISPLLEVLFSCFTVLSAWSNIHCNHYLSVFSLVERLQVIFENLSNLQMSLFSARAMHYFQDQCQIGFVRRCVFLYFLQNNVYKKQLLQFYD